MWAMKATLVALCLCLALAGAGNFTGNVVFKPPYNLEAEAWIDCKPLKRGKQFTTHLKPDKHHIVVRLEAKALPKAFRLELNDVAFLND